MKLVQRTTFKLDAKKPVVTKTPTVSPREILARLRARRDAEKAAALKEAPIDYDVMKRAMARRTSIDQRDLGVSEPRWKEAGDTVITQLSPETIELLAIASLQHTCCNDADFEIRYSYGSGIGTNIVAKCTRCGLRFDITDYSNW